MVPAAVSGTPLCELDQFDDLWPPRSYSWAAVPNSAPDVGTTGRPA